jgi:hypothetical protein
VTNNDNTPGPFAAIGGITLAVVVFVALIFGLWAAIAKTLTPLYVQFEMTQALSEIAKSGRNSSIVYIPSGPGGVPFIQGTGPAVGAPAR